jgi:hypothetical protein
MEFVICEAHNNNNIIFCWLQLLCITAQKQT